MLRPRPPAPAPRKYRGCEQSMVDKAEVQLAARTTYLNRRRCRKHRRARQQHSQGRGRGRGRGRSRSCRWPTVRTAASGYGLSLRNMWTAPGGRPSSGGHRSVNQHSSWLASGCASSARTTPTAHPPPAARSRYRPVAAVRRSRCSLRRGDASTRSPGHDRSAIAAGERIPEC